MGIRKSVKQDKDDENEETHSFRRKNRASRLTTKK